MHTWFSSLLLTLALGLAGCGPAVSPALQQEAAAPGPRLSFAELSAHPDSYKGRVVILGGEVMTVQPQGAGSLMAVNQQELDEHFFPAGQASGGTFLVASDQWLSPAQYQPKSKVTVSGVVQGQRDKFPLLQAREIHFWEGPTWEKWYYPVPRDWYPPGMEFWFTPPYFDPWRGGQR